MNPWPQSDPLLAGEEIARLTTGWDGAVAARIAAAAAALVLAILAVRAFRGRRAIGWAVASVALAGLFAWFAWAPQQAVDAAIGIEYVTRVRLIVLGLSAAVLAATVEAIRRDRLSERHALLWVATAATLIAAALFPKAVALLRACTGMSYANAMVAVLFGFLVLVLFQFSLSLTLLRKGQTALTQRLALLEARLQELENQSLPANVRAIVSDPSAVGCSPSPPMSPGLPAKAESSAATEAPS
jgi:hypothetical protein